ncbi:uncharacterized protein FA14DRAFT_30082 [Meira miltonrushii]|uniref:ferric-chelate reductase (NADPH) n=1 Tax=Meira miltonrushii TaxID=1280837 RepID=A0A316V4S7_9BASI|nr:uncharacterized protein FA14DRAFT_30082 [Meira miltonrushii]PWN31233.1 hypothetical protein FA14DRAFT_30082 [Meira miltonrushii]
MGSVYVPPSSSSGGSCTGGCGTTNDAKYQYLGGYFNAHMLSMPSHRYEYISWIVLAIVILIIAAFHHVGLGDQSYIGAAWSRWALKNRVIKIGKKENQSRKVITFPSFGRTLLLIALVIVPVVLTIVGADYISPSANVFDMSQSWPNTNISRYTVGLNRRSQLMKRLQWGQGNFPSVITTPPSITLPYRTWWTAGGRTGGMTNALTPFVVVIALKQVPFALLSTKFLGGFAFDRLSFMHKWGGRVVWLFATAHIVLWSVQLSKDQAFGGPMWAFVFMWVKFRWGWVSYGFFTLLVALSIGPIRTDYYEFFYIAHVVCAIGFMVTAWLHHPPLGPWMYATLLWWLLERIVRSIKVAYINGLGFAGRKPQVAIGTNAHAAAPYRSDGFVNDPYRNHVNQKSFSASSSVTMHSEPKGMPSPFNSQPTNFQSFGDFMPYDQENSYSNRRKTRLSARYDPVNDVIDGYADSHDAIAMQPVSSTPRYTLHDGGPQQVSPPSSEFHASADHYTRRAESIHSQQDSHLIKRLPHPRPAMAADVAAVLRPGYAYVQLLPGKTLRLTLRTPNSFTWQAGQYVNLNVPKVRWWQSHPFTIASAHNADYPSSTMFREDEEEKGLIMNNKQKGEERTIVLLLRARAGFTHQLWDHVRLEREKQIRAIEDSTGMQYSHGEVAKTATGVHVRAIIDGPFGSAQRTRWGIHSSIVIICGGSGVSFGMAVLEYLCAVMAGVKRGEKNFQTRRVRFVWILREYSHLQWIASALRRCVEMVPPEMLQVDLYVTSARARQFNERRTLYQANASISNMDALSSQGGYSNDDPFPPRFTEGPDQEEYEVDANALTQFDGEDTSAPTAAEAKINERVHKEGKLRRAHTRRATVKRNKGRAAANQTPNVPRSGLVSPTDDTVVRAAQAGIHERAHRPPTANNVNGQRGGAHQLNHYDLGERAMPVYEDDGDNEKTFDQQSSQLQVPRRPSSPSSYFNARGMSPGTSPLPLSPSPYETPRALTPNPMDGRYTPDGFYQPYPASSTTHLNTSFGQQTPHSFSSHMHHHHGSSNLAGTPQMPPMYPDGSDLTPVISQNDVPIDLDEAENGDMGIISELARVGYPKLDRIVREEVEKSAGRVLVSACGPNSLGNLIRSIVSKQIDLKGVRAGKKNAHINVVTESYEWGG